MRETRTTNHNKKTIFLKEFRQSVEKSKIKHFRQKTTIQKVVSNSDFCFIENWTKK